MWFFFSQPTGLAAVSHPAVQVLSLCSRELDKATTKTDWLRYPAGQPSVSKMNCGLAERRVRAQEPLCESRSGRPGIPSVMKWLTRTRLPAASRPGFCGKQLRRVSPVRSLHGKFVLLHCCFTSTEARWLIRDGDKVGRGRQSEGSTAETRRRKRPERPWTAARTAMEGGPLHCALRNCCFNCCAWTELQRQCPLHCCWRRTTWTTREAKLRSILLSPAPPPYSWSLLGYLEGPAPSLSSKISWSFADLAWNPVSLSSKFVFLSVFYGACRPHKP